MLFYMGHLKWADELTLHNQPNTTHFISVTPLFESALYMTVNSALLQCSTITLTA